MSVIGFKVGDNTEKYNYPNLDNKPVIDATPTANSTNAVQSGGVKTAIEEVRSEIPAIDATGTQSGQAADSKTVGDKFNAITENCPNILDPALLPTGTLRGVTITKEDDALVFTGTAVSGTRTISQDIPLTAGGQYTIKIYSISDNPIGVSIVCTGADTATFPVRDLNTPTIFTIPIGATNVQLNINPPADTVYDDDMYRISIHSGRTNEYYIKYFTDISAIDYIARAYGNAVDAKTIIKYPRDTEGEIILPVSEKMLTVKPDGLSEYEDIPEGDVAKRLLFDAFNEDDTKTKVSITINTSGTPVTGEVRGLRNTLQILRGNGTVGAINIHSNGYLWYTGQGRTAIIPVTPGHTYKFVPKASKAEDSWYPISAYFAPGFDLNFTEPYVKIPNTDNSIEFVPADHSTDGTGKVFTGSGVIIPNDMYYMILPIIQTTYDSNQEDNLREFEIYDYTEYPWDATYDKAVEDPVIGDTYNVTYALTRATSSNNVTTVGGSSQYKTTITAEQGKVISSCTIKIGNRTYTPTDGSITINNTASNIKITAAAEAPPDDTYIGAYTVKRELIPEDLLAEKMDTPSGLSRAEENQILYTDGSGGLVIKDPPYVPNRKFSTVWNRVFSQFAGGYYYDPSDGYTYKQIPESDTMWGSSLRERVSCTPFDDLVPVEQGEHYRFQMPGIMVDRLYNYLPGFIIFDANKEVLETIEVDRVDHAPVKSEFIIPKGGVWMAIHYYNAQTYVVQREDVKTFDEFDLLTAIHANYRSFMRGNVPVRKTLDKAHIVIGTDDIRPHQTKRLHELFTSNNIPYYMAAIPDAVKACITDDPYKTNRDYMLECVRLGGEIVTHSADWITPSNVNDFDLMYRYFCSGKKELEFYGFDVHGIFKAGGEGGIGGPDPRLDAWAVYYYEYADSFGYSYPYGWMSRGNHILEYLGTNSVADLVQTAINNRSYVVFIAHEINTNTRDNVDAILDVCSGYTKGVDYDFTTPYELYNNLKPDPEED